MGRSTGWVGDSRMILSTKEDIEAPIDEVFAALSDFEGFERAALRRGAEVQRTDQSRVTGVGAVWKLGFTYRNKRRNMVARLAAMDAPHTLIFTGTGKSISGQLGVDLVALSRRRTRVTVKLEIKPITLVARIYLQSLRLTKTRVTERFAKRVKALAVSIDDRLRTPALGPT